MADKERLIDNDKISRQALLDEINEEIEYGEEHFCPENEQINKGLKIARKLVRALPAIEAEPVKHGRWETWGYIFHGIAWKRCSVCGKTADVSYQALLDGKIEMATPSICGCCGCRMDGDNDV